MIRASLRMAFGLTLALCASVVPVAAQGDYRVESTVIPVTDDEPVSVGAISYVDKTAADRPVLFAFNGGPGASAAYLHIGVLGPWRADVPADPAQALPSAARLAPNDGGVLGNVDVVFLDPPGTGLSDRGANPAALNTVAADASAMACLLYTSPSPRDRG